LGRSEGRFILIRLVIVRDYEIGFGWRFYYRL
jgi:hypothetical protein